MCHSDLIPRDVQCTVKDAEDVHVSVVLHEVRDSVMPMEQDSYVARGGKVSVADFWIGAEDLRPFVDPLDRPGSGGGIICCDVFEDVLEPALGLFGPRYFCHERMRRAIS